MLLVDLVLDEIEEHPNSPRVCCCYETLEGLFTPKARLHDASSDWPVAVVASDLARGVLWSREITTSLRIDWTQPDRAHSQRIEIACLQRSERTLKVSTLPRETFELRTWRTVVIWVTVCEAVNKEEIECPRLKRT